MNKDTLAERNRVYQQRHRAKKRKELGDEKFRQEKRDYMRIYRDGRNHAEGYVKPLPVVKLAEPARKPPVEPRIEIEFREVDRKKKKSKKDVNRLNLLKARLQNRTLVDRSVDTHYEKLKIMYQMFTGDDSETMNGWKQEVKKALKNQTYDEGLYEVISFFKEIKQVVQTLRELTDKNNTYRAYIGAITALLGRLKTSEYDTEYEYASNIGITLQKEYTELRDLNELTAEELAKINKIKFDDKSILQNVNKLSSLRDKALYAVYMYIPRRLEMSTVKIRMNDKNTDKSGNYLILRNTMVPDRFIFNTYKTSATYHRQVVDVPEQIQSILREYIVQNKLGTNDYLFHIGRSTKEFDSGFSKTFSKVFSQVYGENITNQDLRTAYATYWTTKAKSKTEKNKISSMLSHSYEVNEQYVKTNVAEDKKE